MQAMTLVPPTMPPSLQSFRLHLRGWAEEGNFGEGIAYPCFTLVIELSSGATWIRMRPRGLLFATCDSRPV
jgi:hypothetical protein